MNDRWAWVILGLMAWTALVVVWMTGPSHCSPPDPKTHEITCHYNRGPRR